MDIEQLRQEWAGRDNRLEQGIRMNTMLLRESMLEKGRLSVRHRGRPNVLSIVAAIGAIVLLGIFNVNHFLQWQFFVPGVMLHAWIVVVFAAEFYQREQLGHLDYSRPIVKLQGEFELLRMRRLRVVKWSLLTGQLVWWVPFLIVFFKGVVGVDLFALTPIMPTFLACSVIVGLGVILMANWIARFIQSRYGNRPAVQRFTDEFAGADIVAAREFLATLARFQEEASPDQ